MERATTTVMKPLTDRDASFSAYLRPDKPIITLQLPHLEDSTSELSIFDAHKYFNEVATNNDNNIHKVTISSNSRVSPIQERGDVITETTTATTTATTTTTTTTRYSSASSSVDGYANVRNYRARSFHAATPTASSEASWNSQAGLLSHPPGAIPVSMKNPQNPNNKLRTSLSKPIWLLRRNCPCTGKKSVQVKEILTPEHKTQIERDSSMKNQEHGEIDVRNVHITPNNWVVDQTAATFVAAKSQRFQFHNNPNPHRVVSSVTAPFTDGFTFPVLNPNVPITKLKAPNGIVEEDPPRDSLEVFRPPDDVVEPKPPLNFAFQQKSRAVDDDAASDASSDLFEIESFSTATQSTYPAVYRRNSRDSFDDASTTTTATASAGFFFGRRSMDEGSTTPTITECYEPSEASIEWSVTTAEGHDETASAVGAGGAAEERWRRKGGNGLLVSCRCEKAVSVGPQPVKCGERDATSATHVNVTGSGNSGRIGRSHRNAPRVSIAYAT